MKRTVLSCAVLIMAVAFFISGCETVPKKFKEEVSGIKSKVDTLESRMEGVEVKQAEVERAASRQTQAISDLMKTARTKVARQHVKTNVSTKMKEGRSKKQIREIQRCLKNAGFYNGSIDGISGRRTKKAIKAFQKVHGLKADGVVGKMTWEVLEKYSSASAQSTSEEGSVK